MMYRMFIFLSDYDLHFVPLAVPSRSRVFIKRPQEGAYGIRHVRASAVTSFSHSRVSIHTFYSLLCTLLRVALIIIPLHI